MGVWVSADPQRPIGALEEREPTKPMPIRYPLKSANPTVVKPAGTEHRERRSRSAEVLVGPDMFLHTKRQYTPIYIL